MKVVHLDSICVVNNDGCERNLAINLARNIPWVSAQPERTGKLAIVAAGPSVPDYLNEIREFENIWAINGAYDYLLSKGITPTGFVGVDPLPGLVDYITRAHRDTTFYISAICDPSVFDALKDHSVMMWFPEQKDIGFPDGTNSVSGGTTAVTRAPFVADMLGFRDITVFGADSSFKGSRYCYKEGTYPEDSKAPILKIQTNGEGPFYSELSLAKQVAQIMILVLYPWGRGHQKLKVRCDGLMAAYMRAPMETDAEDELELCEPVSAS